MLSKRRPPLTNSAIFKAAQRIPFLTVAVSNRKNEPHGFVVLFDMDKDWNLYFFGDEGAYKHTVIREHPAFAATMFELNQFYIQLRGHVEIVSDEIERETRLIRLSHKAARIEHFWAPLLNLRNRGFVLYKLTPTWIRAMPLLDRPMRPNETRFLEILGSNPSRAPKAKK